MTDGSDRGPARPSDGELVELLRADPDQAARVLGAAKLAVQCRLGVYPAGTPGDAVTLALGMVSNADWLTSPSGWGWWISSRVDPKQPSGVANDADDAMNRLRAALEARGYVIGKMS